MGWTLAEIRTKVRQVTGRLSVNQITDNQLDEYINNYYQFTFPAEVKLESSHTFYEFNTTPLIREYTLPNATYTNIQPPVYLDLQPLLYYQDPSVFYSENIQQFTRSTPWTGDGATVAFSTTLSPVPYIFPTSVIVTDNTEVFTDDGNGILTGDLGGSGAVNYTTGVISVTFNGAPADEQLIYLSYELYKPGRPEAALVYNNVISFYPIPDTVYRAKVKAFRVLDALTTDLSTPDLEEWGECLAYGASREVVSDYGEMERYAEITALYKEQVSYILTRTVENLSNTRSRPMW